MKDGWYYKSIGQVMGPVAFETLAELARDELVHPTDEVRRGPDGTWEPAESIVGLFPEAAGSPVEPTGDLEVAEDMADLNFRFGSTSAPVPKPAPRPEPPVAAPSSPAFPALELPAWSQLDSAPAATEQSTPNPVVSSDADTVHDFGAEETRVPATAVKTEKPPLAAPVPKSKLTETANSPVAKEKPSAPAPVVEKEPKTAPQKPRPSSPDVAVVASERIGRRIVQGLKKHRIALAAAAITFAVAVWFFVPRTDKDIVHVNTAKRLYGEFCQLRARGASDAEWDVYVLNAKAEADAILTEFKRSTIVPKSPRAYLNRAFSEGFTPMIELMHTKTSSAQESEFVSSVNRALLIIDPKADRIVMPGPVGALAPPREQLEKADSQKPPPARNPAAGTQGGPGS
jgi:hypothetical protein